MKSALGNVIISNNGFQLLSELRNVNALSISHTKLSKDNIRSLSSIGVFRLQLPNCGLNDDHLPCLKTLKSIKWLDLQYNFLSDTSIDFLKKKLPGCIVNTVTPFDESYPGIFE